MHEDLAVMVREQALQAFPPPEDNIRYLVGDSTSTKESNGVVGNGFKHADASHCPPMEMLGIMVLRGRSICRCRTQEQLRGLI
jgi:hypothetical protein